MKHYQTARVFLMIFVALQIKGTWCKPSAKIMTTTETPDDVPDDLSAFDKIYMINAQSNNKGGNGDPNNMADPGMQFFEADIMMTPALRKILQQSDDNSNSKKVSDAIHNRKWHNAVVPYVYKSGFIYKKDVQKAFKEIESKTCIRFVPRTNEPGYIEFTSASGCWSGVGYSGSRQTVSIGHGCGYMGVIVHEILHALGFFHEQSRYDRDDYVTINWNNIVDGKEHNFKKLGKNVISTLGEKYDKQSIMHYGNYAFAKNYREKTITSNTNPNEKLGQRRGLSAIDVNQLNKRYCSNPIGTKKPIIRTTTETTQPTTTTTTTTTTTPTTTTPTTTATTATKKLDCTDRMKCCKELATNGLCRNAPFVRENCRYSCNTGQCRVPKTQKPTTTTTTTTTTKAPTPPAIKKTPSPTCIDQYGGCGGWAVPNRYCNKADGCCSNTQYSSYMNKYCRKSCGFC